MSERMSFMNSRKKANRNGGTENNAKENVNSAALADIYNAIAQIRYGSIQIHIQDGKIIQIDTVNKMRVC